MQCPLDKLIRNVRPISNVYLSLVISAFVASRLETIPSRTFTLAFLYLNLGAASLRFLQG
jgi:hypothetical protein